MSEVFQQIIKLGVESVDAILDLIYAEACKVLDLADAQVQFAFYDETKDEVTFPLAIEQDKENGGVIDIVRWGKRDAQDPQRVGMRSLRPTNRDIAIPESGLA